MPCYYPLTAWKSADLDDINSKNGKVKMVFREDQGFPNTKTELPCGKCIGCRIDKARMWAARITNESSLYDWNCFITLTYKNDPWSLNKHDIAQFIKKLRIYETREAKKENRTPRRIRFFQCGEYGELFSRPHHHIILFNYWPKDARHFKTHKRKPIFLSKAISNLWPHGIHSIQELTYDSAAYCAKYVLKKINGEQQEEHYQGRLPEFTTMSLKPGIGADWYEKYASDVYNHDRLVLDSHRTFRPPKYYDSMHEQCDPSAMRKIKQQRRQHASSNPENCEERRAVKAALAKLNEQKLKIRTFEKQSAFFASPPGGASETGGESA